MDRRENESPADADSTKESVSFSDVTTVVTEWMLDFMFVSLCRHFKEGKLDEFNETLKTFETISQRTSLRGNSHEEKTLICAFLARVMHGKQLDVLFEEDESVMPLMSAAKLWPNLEHTVADESLFKNITILLLVQSVAVCLEKGQRSSASSVLKWFDKHHKLPQNLRAKLSTVVAQRKTYHPFLMSFSFSRLQETVQSYLDTYLEKNPSDYLLKAATEVVQTQNTEDLEDVVSQDGSLSETPIKSTQKDRKTKRKLLSTKITDLWTPDSAKKPFVSVKRLSKTELFQMTSKRSPEASTAQKTRTKPRKWTARLDTYLEHGVKRHGKGKWSLILMDHDFEGRTGTMLKDRWRVLTNAHQVD
ncbi:telomeric repeat-binding factor 1 [Odontesthes bonariensis]|uniref:telomeric repeat-binding factor 1 n=1 Tax=Odontesthes bonariensis TaxID=219752 RepID=UPI003F58B969